MIYPESMGRIVINTQAFMHAITISVALGITIRTTVQHLGIVLTKVAAVQSMKGDKSRLITTPNSQSISSARSRADHENVTVDHGKLI